jgi:hypothetical protein
MAHAKKEHLDGLQMLLSEIRKSSVLKEKSLGCFYFKSKGVLHFHIKDTRLFAHVFDGKIWHEVDLVTPMSDKNQRTAAKKIVQLLPI